MPFYELSVLMREVLDDGRVEARKRVSFYYPNLAVKLLASPRLVGHFKLPFFEAWMTGFDWLALSLGS